MNVYTHLYQRKLNVHGLKILVLHTLSLSLTFFFFFFFTSGALMGGDEDFELSRGTGLTDLDAPPIT